MNNLKLKLSMLLCLLGLGLGSASAQSVNFELNDRRGYASEKNQSSIQLSNLSSSRTDWIATTKKGNATITSPFSATSEYKGALSKGAYKQVLCRYTWGSWFSVNWDWITLTYKAPSYSKVTFTLKCTLEARSENAKSSDRASYFDYEVYPYNGPFSFYWRDRVFTPNSQQYINTPVGDLGTNLYNGEKAAVHIYNKATSVSKEFSLSDHTIDNSIGPSEISEYRYGVFSSSKSWSTDWNETGHNTKLSILYDIASISYYKHITFNANGGTGTMARQKIETKGNLTANAFNREGFTFAGWNTKADGSGTQYAEGAELTADANNKGLVTLYAQWTAQPITATFDYTYRTTKKVGDKYEEAFENMDDTHESNAITKKVRAILRDHNRAVLKEFVMEAPDATTPSAAPTSEFTTHKTATVTLNVARGAEATENTVANTNSEYTVTLTPTDYANYRSVDFEVLNAGGSASASHWVSDKENATSYVFKYEGHGSDNMYELTWRVNLKNLSMYPADIFVKPMRQSESVAFDQISPMKDKAGEVCELAGYIKSDGTDISLATYNALEDKSTITITGAYYTGEYNVLKTDAKGDDYTYQLGLTGFTLDGITYYLAAKAGDVPSDMISTATVSSTSDEKEIVFDREDKDIPVLILSPGEGATVSGRENYKLYVDNGTNKDSEDKRTVNLSSFEAVRPGYDFVGWKDTRNDANESTDNGKEYSSNDYYHFNLGTKSTTTLVAQWERTNAPYVEGIGLVDDDTNRNFIYKVKVTDDLGASAIKDVKYTYTNTVTEPSADEAEWEDMAIVNKNEGEYSHTISMLNDNKGKYLWVKVDNGDKHTIIALGEIRSIYRVAANKDPQSEVVEKNPNGKWETPEGKDEPEFTPDGTYTEEKFYDHYSTFHYGNRAFTAYGVTAYTAEISGEQLKLEKVEADEETGIVTIPAGTPVILRKKLATDGTIELEEYTGETVTIENNNNLKGVGDTDETITGDNDSYYVLSYTDQNGVGFYQYTGNTLGAHKAYIKLEEGQNVSAFTFDFSEGDPIVNAIREMEATGKTSVTIDLSGRKVVDGNMQNGVYIKGGHKIMHK